MDIEMRRLALGAPITGDGAETIFSLPQAPIQSI